LNLDLLAGSKFNISSKFGFFFKFRSSSWLKIQLQLEILLFLNFEFRSSGLLEIQLQLAIRVLKILNFDLRASLKFNFSSKLGFWKVWISIFRTGSKFNSSSKFGFYHFEFRSSSWLEIQLQLKIPVLIILNFDLRASLKFNSSSKFGFWKFWISIFELARNSTPARNSALLDFEFRFSSWLEIQL
jgi:hypothetical protein